MRYLTLRRYIEPPAPSARWRVPLRPARRLRESSSVRLSRQQA